MSDSRYEILHEQFNQRWAKAFPDIKIDASVDLYFEAVVRADPTCLRDQKGNLKKVGRYADWIIRTLFRQSSSDQQMGDELGGARWGIIEWDRFVSEDAEKTCEELDIFHRRKHLLEPEYRDINRFKSFSEFGHTIRVLKQLKTQSEIAEEIAEETTVVGEDDICKIVIPRSYRASQTYGANTRWCTAGQSDYHFYNYNRTAPLYIIIEKATKAFVDENGQTPELHKYQLHFQTGCFADETDEMHPLEYIWEAVPSAKAMVTAHLASLDHWNDTPADSVLSWLARCDPAHPKFTEALRNASKDLLKNTLPMLAPETVKRLVTSRVVTAPQANRALHSPLRIHANGTYVLQINDWDDAVNLIPENWRSQASELFSGDNVSFRIYESGCGYNATDYWKLLTPENREHVLTALRREFPEPDYTVDEKNAPEFLADSDILSTLRNAYDDAATSQLESEQLEEFRDAITDHFGPAQQIHQCYGKKRRWVLRFTSEARIAEVIKCAQAQVNTLDNGVFPWADVISIYCEHVHHEEKYSRVRDRSESSYPDNKEINYYASQLLADYHPKFHQDKYQLGLSLT